MSNDGRTIRAVGITSRLLDALAAKPSAGVTELADELGIAKSAVYNHLNTLREHNYVAKEDGRYNLSLTYVSLAETVKNRLGFYDVLVDETERLAEETGEVAQFALEEQAQLVYLHRANGENAVELLTDTGSSEMFHCTGLGKVILANLPDERVEAVLTEQGLTERTGNTITDRSALEAELDRIRDRGYAIDNEEAVDGLRCVAAPTVLGGRATMGAVSISGPVRRMTDERIESELVPKVLQAANVVELISKISESDVSTTRQ
jgi:DNA-binding IclR family transcriptional regulator